MFAEQAPGVKTAHWSAAGQVLAHVGGGPHTRDRGGWDLRNILYGAFIGGNGIGARAFHNDPQGGIQTPG